MRSHLKDVTLLVCDKHVRTCWGHIRHRRKSNFPLRPHTPQAEVSSLSPENKDGSTAGEEVQLMEVAWGGGGGRQERVEASPGGITQSPELRLDYVDGKPLESLKRESNKIQLQFDNSLTLSEGQKVCCRRGRRRESGETE